MKINLIKVPFHYIIIEDFYDQIEYKDVWEEMMFLIPKLRSPEKTGAASDTRTGPIKRGTGIFLDTFYQNCDDSNIFNASRKINTPYIIEQICRSNILYAPYRTVNKVAMLVQHYRNGDFYLPHKDSSLYTAVTLLHREPKQYTGGEFYFEDYNHVCKLDNNQTIIFPSVISHGVSEVKLLSNDPHDARFTVTQLMYVTP